MAAQRNPLRAVKSSDQVTPAPVKTVAQAAKSGQHRDLLVAMRDRIAEAVAKTDCPPRDLASLTRRLQDIAKDIASLDAAADQEQGVSGDIDETFDASAI